MSLVRSPNVRRWCSRQARSQAIGPRQHSSQSSQHSPPLVIATLPKWASPWTAWTGPSGSGDRVAESEEERGIVGLVRREQRGEALDLRHGSDVAQQRTVVRRRDLVDPPERPARRDRVDGLIADVEVAPRSGRWPGRSHRRAARGRPHRPVARPAGRRRRGTAASARLSASASGPRTRPVRAWIRATTGDGRSQTRRLRLSVEDDRIVDRQPQSPPDSRGVGDELQRRPRFRVSKRSRRTTC